MLGWRKIVNEFSGKTNIPIKLEDVESEIIKTGAVARFDVLGIETAHDTLLGGYMEYAATGVYGEPTVGCVRYKKDLHPYWQKLVCCKEMLHALDKQQSFDGRGTTQTADQISGLIAYFSNGEHEENGADKLHTVLDRCAIIPAIAILFPITMVHQYRHHVANSKKDIKNIAGEVHLPEEIVKVVLDPRWNPNRLLNVWIAAEQEEE